jgi:sugar phosphate isomerase/epimerase
VHPKLKYKKENIIVESGIKYSAITGSLGKIGDRYNLGGYKEDSSLEDRVIALSKVQNLKGIEISEDDIKGLEVEFVKDLIKRCGLAVSAVGLNLTTDPKWKFGSLVSKDEEIRNQAIAVVKSAIDFASEVGSGLVNIWLGQEGFDYPMQANYFDQWDRMVANIRECADYNPNIKIALEPKPREPRNRCLIDSTATGLLLAMDIDRDNVGVTVDVGHVLIDGKNMAQSIAYAAGHGKLFNLHANDNYSSADDDMIVGSVHMVEFIELFFYLKKINYDKWCSVDIFPYREESISAVDESIRYMTKFEELIDLIGFDKLDACLKSDNAAESIRLIRESIFK